MWYIWLIVAGVCFIIEMLTVGFFVFWFGIGALITMIISILFPDNMLLQATIFVISSTILIFLTKPFVDKFTKKDKKIVTNAYSIIGKKGIVTQDIKETYGIGQVKISGETWSAKTSDGSVIEKGSQIEVIQIDGVKAVVQLVSTENTAVLI